VEEREETLLMARMSSIRIFCAPTQVNAPAPVAPGEAWKQAAQVGPALVRQPAAQDAPAGVHQPAARKAPAVNPSAAQEAPTVNLPATRVAAAAVRH
jgi:hypothetical protein